MAGEAAGEEASEPTKSGSEASPEEAPSGDVAADMSAAEALARATEAAATAASEPRPAAEPEPEIEATPEPEAEIEPQPEPRSGSAAAPESEPAPAAEPAAEPTEAARPEPEPAPAAGPEAESGTEAAEAETETVAEPAEPAEPEPEPAPAAEPEAESAPIGEPAAETAGPAEPAAEPTAETAAKSRPEADAAPAAQAAPESDAPPTDEPPAEGAPSPAEGAAEESDTAKPAPPPEPDRPELRVVREAMAKREPLEGRVIGWNNGGFHLALGDLSAFCPRSEMEIGEVQEPESYLDKSFLFRVLRLQGKGRRIVVSRAAHLRREKTRQRSELRKRLKQGAEIEGTVVSLTDFGAFVDLGGAQGLVHVSEISHRRVEHPSHVLSEGQQVKVKVLRVEHGGRRISLSMRALEPDPWKDLADRFPRGAVVKGKVEKANKIGAFIELAPGLTGLLPAKSMSIPRETNPARAYPPGKEVSVQIVSVDPRRQRIALALEGSGLEGSRNDYQEYKRQARESGKGGFNALASAFKRLQDE